MRKTSTAVAFVMLAGGMFWGPGAGLAQEDIFAFIPPGGRGLLEGMLAEGLDAAGLATATAQPRTAAQWLDVLAGDGGGLPAAPALDDWQRQTLADYLAYAGPLGDPASLPQDGRDMTLTQCQSCHIVTVVVTQERTREAWLGTMGKPSHVMVPLTPEERGQLADYLVVNAGIPIDDIPVELRAGGASY